MYPGNIASEDLRFQKHVSVGTTSLRNSKNDIALLSKKKTVAEYHLIQNDTLNHAARFQGNLAN